MYYHALIHKLITLAFKEACGNVYLVMSTSQPPPPPTPPPLQPPHPPLPADPMPVL